MGKYLKLDETDTYEVYMLLHGLTEHEFPQLKFSNWIFSMKQIYGSEKGLTKHFYMGDFLIKDHADFHKWIADTYDKAVLAAAKQ